MKLNKLWDMLGCASNFTKRVSDTLVDLLCMMTPIEWVLHIWAVGIITVALARAL